MRYPLLRFDSKEFNKIQNEKKIRWSNFWFIPIIPVMTRNTDTIMVLSRRLSLALFRYSNWFKTSSACKYDISHLVFLWYIRYHPNLIVRYFTESIVDGLSVTTAHNSASNAKSTWRHNNYDIKGGDKFRRWRFHPNRLRWACIVDNSATC